MLRVPPFLAGSTLSRACALSAPGVGGGAGRGAGDFIVTVSDWGLLMICKRSWMNNCLCLVL